ncbi:DUF2993 domain-containing protein [Frankia nepalensis]|uniref:DUF2993 domain-containing protein n=1 Tax=Frankia nepalensis TaxID=1836974 RepID=UPI0027DE9F97|nr:LmeA family phospholipid-binding protein [Frankia nepalensis]
MNNAADDEAYDSPEATRLRRDSGDTGRKGPSRPGAPSAPPPPAESFRPAGPPPPADWFKPASGRGPGAPGGQPGRGGDTPARSRRDSGDETVRPRRDQAQGGPGSAGYTSQPGIPAERYPTPRPGEYPAPVPPARRTTPPAAPPVPPAAPSPSTSGGTPRPAQNPAGAAGPGRDRPTEYIGRVGSEDATGPRSLNKGAGAGEPTEQLRWGARGGPASAEEQATALGGQYEAGRGGWVAGGDSGGWGAGEGGGWVDGAGAGGPGTGGYVLGAPATGGTPVPGGGAPEEKKPKRRRRGRKIALIVLLVLVVGFIPADRLAANFAVGQMRKSVEDSLAVSLELKEGEQPPIVRKVSIGGFPFLTQPLLGKFKDLGVVVEQIPTPGPKISSVDAHLKGLHVPLGDAITGNIGEIPVDDVTATVKMNYTDLNAFLKDQPLHLQLEPAEDGKKVKLTGTATAEDLNGDLGDLADLPGLGDIPGLGNLGNLGIPGLGDANPLSDATIEFSGIGAFEVKDNILFIRPTSISGKIKIDAFGVDFNEGGGLKLPPGLTAPVEVPLPDELPFELNIVSAGSDATGLSLTANAKDVILPEAPKAK